VRGGGGEREKLQPSDRYNKLVVVFVILYFDTFVLCCILILKIHFTTELNGAQSRYFELFWLRTKLPLNGRKPENNSLIR